MTLSVALLVLTICADAFTTAWGLRAGAVESNPRLGWLIERFGIRVLALTHGAMVAATLWLVPHALAALPLAALFGAAALKNVEVLARLKVYE